MSEYSKKILILKSDKTDFERFFIKHMQCENVVTEPLYRTNSGPGWLFAVLILEKMGLPFFDLFCGKWKYKLREYDCCIVFDRNLGWDVLSYIKTKNPSIQRIAWYWNPVKENHVPETLKLDADVWSFNERDCIKYGYSWNSQFYFPEIKNYDNKAEPKYDAMFIGSDKGRRDTICDIIDRLENSKKKVYCNIIPDKKASRIKRFNNGENTYEEVLSLIDASRCIIDVVQTYQDGLTIRVLEALCLNKKLITTNKSIRQMRFYHPSNILIWDDPDEETINLFFEQEIQPIPKSVISYYSFQRWIERFGVS